MAFSLHTSGSVSLYSHFLGSFRLGLSLVCRLSLTTRPLLHVLEFLRPGPWVIISVLQRSSRIRGFACYAFKSPAVSCLKTLNKRDPRNTQFISFTMCAFLSTATRSRAIRLCPPRDVGHPAVPRLHLSLGSRLVIRSTVTRSQCLCSHRPYLTK